MTCGVSDDTRLRFTTNERADVIDASGTNTPVDASVPQSFDTKGGNDTVTAGPLADIVSAGNGNDAITGGPGPDQLRGDAGNDSFSGLSARAISSTAVTAPTCSTSPASCSAASRSPSTASPTTGRPAPMPTCSRSRPCAARPATTS